MTIQMEKPKEQETPTNVISIGIDDPCIQCGNLGASQISLCLDCVAEGIKHKIPSPHHFRDEDGVDVDYLIAPGLKQIGKNLIKTYDDDFDSLNEARIDYFWKKTGGGSNGKMTLGKCKRVTGDLKYYSQKDFLIWLGADTCWGFSQYQITAIVFHELKHARLKDTGWALSAHDFEGFGREVEIFGLWKEDIASMKPAFDKASQPSLFNEKAKRKGTSASDGK